MSLLLQCRLFKCGYTRLGNFKYMLGTNHGALCAVFPHQNSKVHTTPLMNKAKVSYVKPGIRESVLDFMDKRFQLTFAQRYPWKDLNMASHVILDSIYSKVDFTKILQAAKLEESFPNWLKIVFLHIWMVGVKLKQEDRDGKVLFKLLIKLFWDDIETRVKKIEDEIEQHLSVKKRLMEYHQELLTSFCIYDEGLVNNDSTLASAVWWKIFSRESDLDPIAVEALVHYIRYSVKRLDNIPMEKLVLDTGNIEWSLPENFNRYE